MSFKPQGASLPAKFKKNTTSNFRQTPKHRLCIVDGFDVSAGVIRVTEWLTNRKIEARINPEKAGSPRGAAGAADKWSGNIIDERMSKHLAVGQRIVLEGCETEKKLQRNGEEVSLMRCNWVSNLPDQAPEKSFVTLATFNAYDNGNGNRIVGVQSWKPKNGDVWVINPASEEGEADIEELGKLMDDVVDKYHQQERLTPYGVQFRALVPTSETRAEKPLFELVDMSPPFDWIAGEKNASNEVVSKGHPMDRAHLEGFLTGYLDYVYGSQDQNAPDAEPGLAARGIVPEGAEIVVEVVVYKAYPGAIYSDDLALRNERAPLSRLSSVMAKYSQTDDSGYMGKNWGVETVIVLTADKAPKDRNDTWSPRNMVMKAYPNGYGFHVQSSIPTTTGGLVRVHPSLDRVRENTTGPAGGENKAEDAGANRRAAAAASLTPAAQLTQSVFEEDNQSDYFTNALNPVVENAEAPADTQSSATPSAESQDNTGSDKTEQKSGSSRFRRNA